MPASSRNRNYREVSTGQIVWAQRQLLHSTGAPLGSGDWKVVRPDGTTKTMAHADFAAAHVPAE